MNFPEINGNGIVLLHLRITLDTLARYRSLNHDFFVSFITLFQNTKICNVHDETVKYTYRTTYKIKQHKNLYQFYLNVPISLFITPR